MLAITVALGGCAAATTRTASRDETVEVTLSDTHKKATVSFEDRRYRLGLAQIVDSRCPANAKCIWRGELAARIGIERVDQGTAAREITLGESTVPSMEIMGAKLVLVAIDETSVTFTIEILESH